MKQKKQAFNPFLPSYEYIPDGEPYVFGDRVYIYGSHDEFNGREFCMNDYVCWSASVDDLSDWKYEGVIFKKSQDPEYSKKTLLFAPDVAKGADGRYYLYYSPKGRSVTGVAVSDTPSGPFDFYGYVSDCNEQVAWQKDGDPFQFDPAVFVDDDGKVYLYTGFAPVSKFGFMIKKRFHKSFKGAYVVELEDDMKTIKGDYKVIFKGTTNYTGLEYKDHEFFEASSMRKIGDTYYFIYSSKRSNELCYATSNHPMGEFTYGGVIISIADHYINGHVNPMMGYNYSGNTHGSIVKIKDEWYVFYHRQTNKHMFSRQAMAEKIEILDNRSIPQVEVTSCGLNGKPLEGKGEYEARIACHLMHSTGTGLYSFMKKKYKKHPYFTQTGKDKENNPDQYIANFTNGCKAGFKYFDIAGTKEISVNIKGTAEGTVYVLDGVVGKYVGEIGIAPSKDIKKFTGFLKIKDGKQALYFTFVGTGSFDFHSIILE